MATAHDVAAAVLHELGPMTAMKLEKLVYYCQGWHSRARDTLFSRSRSKPGGKARWFRSSTVTTDDSAWCPTGHTVSILA